MRSLLQFYIALGTSLKQFGALFVIVMVVHSFWQAPLAIKVYVCFAILANALAEWLKLRRLAAKSQDDSEAVAQCASEKWDVMTEGVDVRRQGNGAEILVLDSKQSLR